LRTAGAIIGRTDLRSIADLGTIGEIVDTPLVASPANVDDFRAGRRPCRRCC
jgi:hypothetical protein